MMFESILQTGNRLPSYNYSYSLNCLGFTQKLKPKEEGQQNSLASLPCYSLQLLMILSPCYITSSTQQSDSNLISHSLPLFLTAIRGQRKATHTSSTRCCGAHHKEPAKQPQPGSTEHTKHFTFPRLITLFLLLTMLYLIWTQGKLNLSVWCNRVHRFQKLIEQRNQDKYPDVMAWACNPSIWRQE